MGSFISDAEMERIDSQSAQKGGGFVSDAEMLELDRQSRSKRGVQSEGPSKSQTLLESYGNSATLGYLPHIQAALEGLLPSPTGTLDKDLRASGFTVVQPEKGYVERRDENLKRMAAQRAENPKTAALGDVAGLVGGAFLTNAVAPVKAAATLGGRAVQAARTGGVLGAVQNPGDAEGVLDPIQLGQRVVNSAAGTAIGPVAQLGVEGTSLLLKKIASGLKSFAEKKAFKALGPYSREAQQNYAKDQINEIGREVLDSGVVRGRPTSYEGISARAGAAKDRAGKNVGAVIDDLAAVEEKLRGPSVKPGDVAIKGQRARSASVGVDRNAIADSLEKDLISKTDIPGVEKDNAFFKNLIDSFRSREKIGVKDAQDMKVRLKKLINWDRLPGADIPREEQFYRALYKKLNTGINDAATVLAEKAGGDMPSRLAKAKKSYGAMAEAARISSKREGKEFANRFLSPSDYFTGGVGAAAGFASGTDTESKLKNAAIGLTAAGANKLARRYGNQLVAAASDALSRRSGAAATALAGSGPVTTQTLVANLMNSGNRKMTRADVDQYLNNPQLLMYFRQNPQMIDIVLKDPKRRQAMKEKIGRGPAAKDSIRLKALGE